MELIQETESPTGIPRHAYETPVFRIREGVKTMHWKSWPRIDEAIASYEVFRKLQAQGIIPPDLAAWLPSILFGVLGIILFARVRT